MMSERQRQIDARLDSVPADDTMAFEAPAEVDLPYPVSLSGREFMLNRHAGDWVIYPAACPHQLGPLRGEVSEAGEVQCPWHGYTFNVRTGACTSGASCRFGQVPSIEVSDDALVLRWA